MKSQTIALAVRVEEAARLVGVGRGYLYQQISEGHLRARKAGRRTLIGLSDLWHWFEALPTFLAYGSSPDPTARSRSLISRRA